MADIDDKVDLKSRSYREILVETYLEVKQVKEKVSQMEVKHVSQEIEIATIKTQLKFWAIIWGSVSAIIVSVITNFV
jgi:3'-phosphoadenosine 5'-phosphosulfate sulfotransferase